MNGEKVKMIEELHAQLEWYTKTATEEEFDPKAVESILYLLDIYEPLEAKCTDVDEAWIRFERRIGVQGNNEAKHTKETGTSIGKSKKVIAFVQRQKIVVAVTLIILLLALWGTSQVEAIKQNGFFFWLRQDEGGRQMITTPESLESTLDSDSDKRYYDWDEVPEWCLELLQVKKDWEEERVEWKYVDVMQVHNYKVIKSCYGNGDNGEEVSVGIISYTEKISINTEVFDDYGYMRCYDGKNGMPIYVYSRVDTVGNVFYRLCRIEDNHIHFVEGTNLQILEDLVEKI